jgi:hypothetical protein
MKLNIWIKNPHSDTLALAAAVLGILSAKRISRKYAPLEKSELMVIIWQRLNMEGAGP